MRMGAVIKKWRLVTEQTRKQVAFSIGISESALVALENESHATADGETIRRVMNWLLTNEPTKKGKAENG